ncbi:MAG: hypothetical protein QXW10_03245, partial [Candidatus Micrarchaeaceae archaeon]
MKAYMLAAASVLVLILIASIDVHVAAAAQLSEIPMQQGSTPSCPSGTTNQGSITYSSNTVLTGDVCANYITIDGGFTLTTNGYSLTATVELINYGTITGGTGAKGGTALAPNGNNGNLEPVQGQGGAGGNGAAEPTDYSTGGPGGGGPSAYGGVPSSTYSSPVGGNDGGGGAAGSTSTVYSIGYGGAAGGSVYINAYNLLNYGTINVSGSSSTSPATNFPGGGGGGGLVYLYITGPNQPAIGTVLAKGGNAGSMSSNNGNCGGGGGGGGGLVIIYTQQGVTPDTSGIEVNGGSGSEKNGCPSGQNGNSGQIVTLNIPQPVQPVCSIDTATAGDCTIPTLYTITTNYNNYAGNGGFVASESAESPMPYTSNILSANFNAGQWLITCPLAPNVLNTTEYFSSNYNSFILGNRCLASQSPLQTTVGLNTSVAWSLYNYATALISPVIAN